MSAAAAISGLLAGRGETVAVAESLTGGLLAASLTETAGASATFRGALVVYATDLKITLAGVPEAILDRYGPVHEEVALALGRGAIAACTADWGVGVTGVAGPEEQGGQPVGTVCIAVICRDGRSWVQRVQLPGRRSDVRSGAVTATLSALMDQLATTRG